MPEKQFVRPARPEVKVRMPEGGHLPPEGGKVLLTTYWRRRLRAGEVTTVPAGGHRSPEPAQVEEE